MLYRDYQQGKIKTVAKLQDELLAKEWCLETTNSATTDTSPSAEIRRASRDSSQAKSLPVGMQKIDLTHMFLPTKLWKKIEVDAQVFFQQWKQALVRNGGDFQALAHMEPPTKQAIDDWHNKVKCV